MILYRERVLPSASNLALPLLLFPSVWAVMLPIDASLAVPVAALLTTVFVLVIFSAAPAILLTETTFEAKGALIDRMNLGEARFITKDERFLELGPGLDARAWLSVQSSVKGLVRVEVKDPADPTPYWLISTRQPERLIKLLNS